MLRDSYFPRTDSRVATQSAVCSKNTSCEWQYREPVSISYSVNTVEYWKHRERASWQKPSRRTRLSHDNAFDCKVFQWAVSVSKESWRVLLVLTLSVHVCELRICKFVESLVACSIRHVRFDFFHPTHVCLRSVEVTIFDRPRQLPHVDSHNSHRDPTLLMGQRRQTMEGQMGGSPKAFATASGRGNQPAEDDPESNRSCQGSHNIREMATSAVNSSETSQASG